MAKPHKTLTLSLKNILKDTIHRGIRKDSVRPHGDKNREWEVFYSSYKIHQRSFHWKNLSESENTATFEEFPQSLNWILIKSVIHNPESLYITCIDEGVSHSCARKKIIPACIPGSGVLSGDKQGEIINRILTIIELYRLKNVVITSHTDCGAAGIAAKRFLNGNEDYFSKNYFSKFVDIFAQNHAEKFKNELQNRIPASMNVHVETKFFSRLDRPKFHHAFGVVINFVPHLNTGLLEDLLYIPMFTISAFLVDLEMIVQDVMLAYSISCSEHGFLNKFSSDNPFEVLICIQKNDDLEVCRSLVNKMPKNEPLVYSIVKINEWVA